MYHSITFGDGSLYTSGSNEGQFLGINTWDDWHLIPSAAPSVATPEVYTNYLDLPGIPGKLDLSEYLTGAPVYKNRSGSFEFYAPPGYGFWAERYAELCNFLHGKKWKMCLEDEPEYFYEGRFKVDPWKREASWGSVSIGYELYPMKYLLPRSSFDQYWDRYRLDDKHIYKCYEKITTSTSARTIVIPGYPNGFMLDAEIDDSSAFPSMAKIDVNGTQLVFYRESADSVTVKSGQASVVKGSNSLAITAVQYPGSETFNKPLVNLVIWGGTL